ncbi:MAG: DUF481 domain-containing protein, partial [Gammaproteobacteria bacterium]|nr:DUF481 domain-containing protein [Gammaproteobacteria bacterium]
MKSKSIKMIIGVSAFCLMSSEGHADWSGEFELGASNATGNSKTSTVNTLMDITKYQESWRHNIFGQL